MDPFSDLVKLGDVKTFLKDSHKYLAHTPNEKLSDHMELVTYYFIEIVRIHGLESLIDAQLLQLCGNNIILASFCKKQFWHTILYHDFGKVNENFQRDKMGNYLNFPYSASNGIESQHSILSAFIFLIHKLSETALLSENINNEFVAKAIHLIFAFSHNIIRHHGSHLDDLSVEKTFQKFESGLCERLEEYLKCYELPFQKLIIKNLPVWKREIKFEKLGFEWFAIVRLNFSLLTAADYYATSHYCNGWKQYYSDFGTLTDKQRQSHFENLKKSQPHNIDLYDNHKQISAESLQSLMSKNNANLNRLRSKMAADVIENIRRFDNKRLFYIEAPTGSGKTNMAIIASMELLHKNPQLNKVFYVFPFTTLVTQTQKVTMNTLGLGNNDFIELHGKAAWKQKSDGQDGLYGDNYLDDIHNQFANYPYTFLSHVLFFEILKGNDKSSIYLMHRLANSIIVIDEIQAYNPELWDKMAYLFQVYAQALNIRFIVMSATLPKIGTLANSEYCYLIPDAIERFFVNPNFADRVDFSDELLKVKQPKNEEREGYLNWLVKIIYDKSEQYRNQNGQVRTIVEFIFKKSATEFASFAEDLFIDYEIFVLSGTIIEPRRRQIINELKGESNQFKNVLLITTQVVEAGVDIDMDLGFKNRSIIDSEEQLAGRVNRNVKKQNCRVYLFDLDDASVIYGKDLRFKQSKTFLQSEYFEILISKRFDKLYNLVTRWLNNTNQEKGLAGTASDYKNRKFGQLNFPGIDKDFTLIDQSNTNVFVPIDLPLKMNSNYEADHFFTDQQLEFLSNFNIFAINGYISGAEVFELYRQLITLHSKDFVERKVNLKILQSILSMFTFSLFSDSKTVKELVTNGNQEEYGFLYLSHHTEVYDYTKGLLDSNFKNLIFL